MNRKPRVAFDVDGTLFDEHDYPRWDIVQILRYLHPYCTVIVWSGSGVSYAKMKGRLLFLPAGVIYWSKGAPPQNVDISFDDEDVTLATVNIKVTHEEQ